MWNHFIIFEEHPSIYIGTWSLRYILYAGHMHKYCYWGSAGQMFTWRLSIVLLYGQVCIQPLSYIHMVPDDVYFHIRQKEWPELDLIIDVTFPCVCECACTCMHGYVYVYMCIIIIMCVCSSNISQYLNIECQICRVAGKSGRKVCYYWNSWVRIHLFSSRILHTFWVITMYTTHNHNKVRHVQPLPLVQVHEKQQECSD